MNYRILAINPGSTSTKIAVYVNDTPILQQVLRHPRHELAQFDRIYEQYPFREKTILQALAAAEIDVRSLHAVAGRGGLLRPMPSGTYLVNQAMVADLRVGISGQHACNLGGLLAFDIARRYGLQAYVVDPVVVDEMQPVARVSGLPGVTRQCIFHALNQKAIARRAAQDLGQQYEEINLVVAHLGGGISVGAHEHGLIIDVNNALDGEGPFSPERTGDLPVRQLAAFCFSGQYSEAEIRRLLVGRGGLMAYLDTNDAREVVQRINNNDAEAALVYEAMAYQIAKEIGRAAAVLRGQVDAIVLTGGLAYDRNYLLPAIERRISFIAPVLVYPGEDELLALVQGVLRVLKGEEAAQIYEPGAMSCGHGNGGLDNLALY